MVVTDRWSLYRNTANNNHLKKWPLSKGFLKKSACQIWREKYFGRNQPFIKFVEAANNFKKFVKLANNFKKFVNLANNFTKFVGLANNFYKVCRSCEQLSKFVGLANNFWKVRKTRKNFIKYVDWKVGFKFLKIFLYLILPV